MERTRVSEALAMELGGPEDSRPTLIRGWVRTRRDSKEFSFLEINDGSCLKNLQVIVDAEAPCFSLLKDATTGAAVEVRGKLIPSPGKGQTVELRAEEMVVYGTADPQQYPLQKKRHSDEFLRTIAHLRPRTNKYGALFRIRSEASFAVHAFFRSRGFVYLHAPIITGSDCEGAGEMFRVATHPGTEETKPGTAADAFSVFFGREANLTVSGQLEAELFALALGDVYTFGPTFRAENSDTPRHAAEFWMIEPECAFADNSDNMDLAEALVKALVGHVMDHCAQDLELFARFVDTSLMGNLETIANTAFIRIPYAEAIDQLKKAKEDFVYPVEYGLDLQTEHERYLCEKRFRQPVFVHDYPKSIKPFYMRVNDDDKTVAAMDLLVPRAGELVGGSQREERMDVLQRRMDEMNLNSDDYWWYLDMRRFGSAPHAGFGLGFERFLMMVTGVTNIRDVIPFPRTTKHLEF